MTTRSDVSDRGVTGTVTIFHDLGVRSDRYVGGELVGALRHRGAAVRALTRDGAQARLPDGVEVALGDLNEPESLAGPLTGVSGLFLLAGYADMPGVLRRPCTPGSAGWFCCPQGRWSVVRTAIRLLATTSSPKRPSVPPVWRGLFFGRAVSCRMLYGGGPNSGRVIWSVPRFQR